MPTEPSPLAPQTRPLPFIKQTKKHAGNLLADVFFVILFVYLTYLRHLTSQNTLFSVFFNC